MYERILVPIALDHMSHANESLKVARRLLAKGGTIDLLHVIEDTPSFAQSYLPEGTLEANKAQAVAEMDALAKECGSDCTGAVVHGKPHMMILEQAKASSPDCIIIASHKPGLEDYFIGSTASRVVRYAKCCVHVLR